MKEYLPIIKHDQGCFAALRRVNWKSCSAAWKRESRPIEKKNIF